MNTLAACTARFTRTWMSVFALILLGASPSAIAATETLAPTAPASVLLTFTSLANSVVFVAPATTCHAAVANTNGIAKAEYCERATFIATEDWESISATGYSLTATNDVNLHFVYGESGHLVVKKALSGTFIHETVYLDYLSIAALR